MAFKKRFLESSKSKCYKYGAACGPKNIRIYVDFGYTSFGRLKTLQVSNNGLTTRGSKLYHSKSLVDSLAASSVRAKCTNHYFMLYQIKEKFILFICFVEPHRELIFSYLRDLSIHSFIRFG